MANQLTDHTEMDRKANLINIRDWERERQHRLDSYASVLHHLKAAYDAVPAGDDSAQRFLGEISFAVQHARGRLSAIFDETNPFVGPRPSDS